MFKATRELIKARQIYTDYVVEVVSVKQIHGGSANDCFNNAWEYIEKNKLCKVASGWLVNKYDAKSNSTEIIQHFWNINEQGIFVDTTPLIEAEYEYVIDSDLSIYGQEYFDEIDNCVGSSLLLKDGKFSTVDLIDGRHVRNTISELKTKNLFNAVRIKKIEKVDCTQVMNIAHEMEIA
jgi:hypothetical protein